MANQKRESAIAGIHEYPLRVAPDVSAMQIKIESIRAALDDALPLFSEPNECASNRSRANESLTKKTFGEGIPVACTSAAAVLRW